MRYWLLLLLSWCVFSLEAQEEILNFHSDIEIDEKGEILVKEIIRVRAEGNEIQRGIYRDLPVTRPGITGTHEPAPIEVISLKRDGEKEAYHTQKRGRNIRIYIGSKSRDLDPGVYTYEIVYKSVNQVGYFDDYDELYWNVVGHQWTFPILEYSATIRLPGEAEYVQGACYTGPSGSQQSECTIEFREEDQVVFAAGTGSLRPREGFTIAVAWPKGYVDDAFSKKLGLGLFNKLLFFAGLFVFVFLGHKWWQKVGIDPEKPPVVPDWSPPEGLSPAEVCYIFYKRVTDKAISAALVSAGVKGKIRIENERRKFTISRLASSEGLEQEEAVLVDRLVPGNSPFVMKSSNYRRFQSAKSSFQGALKAKRDLSEYFLYNWKYVIRASLLMALIISLVLSIGMYPLSGSWIKSFLITFVGSLVVFAAVSVPFYIEKWFRWILILPVVVIASGIFVMIYSGTLFFANDLLWIGVMVGIAAFAVGLFNYLIYAPTVKGQEITSQLEGFRMYLDKSEKEILDYFTPPEKTPELFEKLLPYAIALGVENRWNKKFEKVLSQAIEQKTYAPIWYTGNIHQINRLHSDFSSAVSSAAPKSSSGSGGGGFSGGGGGGGGGGGW